MRFLVSRTSLDMDRGEPCPEATEDGHEWYVELADLSALLAFIDKHGAVVLQIDAVKPPGIGPFSLEIYDTYRE